MDFKVEVSLWNMPSAGNAPAGLATGTPFSAKLGLQAHSQDARNAFEGQSQPQSDAPPTEAVAANAAQVGNRGPADFGAGTTPRQVHLPVGLPGMLELYPLGLQAGPRLSHLPSGYLEAFEGEQGAAVNHAANALGQSIELDSAAAQTLQGPTSSSGVPTAYLPPSSTKTDTWNAGISASEQLTAYLARKWPERSCLLLPRGNGIELLIRDYHLTPAERESLATELLQRLRMSSRPEQLWINGHCVWRRETSSNLQGDE